VGKTTTITHLAQLLKADNAAVHLTAEPSRGAIKRLAHNLTDTVTGPALACLYAADRKFGQIDAFPPVTNGPFDKICDKNGFANLGQCDVEFAQRALRSNRWRIDLF